MFDDLSFILKLLVIVFLILIVVGVLLPYLQKKKQEKEKIEFERYKREQQHKREREEYEMRERLNRADAHRRRIEREKENEKRKQKDEFERQQNEFERRRKDIFRQKLEGIPRYEINIGGEKHNRNNTFIVECKNVTKSTSLNRIKDFIAVDTETTGLRAQGNDIIQLSAIKFINFEPVEIFSTYIKPRKSIPPDATAINGITDDMVENAPKFYEIIDSFNDFIGDLPLVAHNAPFDMKHLYVNGLDSVENKTVYDTLELSRKILKDEYSYKLCDICKVEKIYLDDAHNAESDCLACGLLFVNLVADRREISVEQLIASVN